MSGPNDRRPAGNGAPGIAGADDGNKCTTGARHGEEPAQLGLAVEQPRRRYWTDDLHGGDAGQRDALAGLNAGHRAAAAAELERWASTGKPFTADQVRAALDGEVVGPSDNWVGGLFAAASRNGLIRQVGWTNSTRDVAKGHALRVWVGTAQAVA